MNSEVRHLLLPLKPTKALLPLSPPTLQLSPPPLLQVLKKCSTISHLKQFHAHLVTTPFPPHPLLLHALVRTYNSLGCLTLAALLFDRSPPPPTNVLWNVLIRAFSKSPTPQQSLHLLRRMLVAPSAAVFPDNYTFTFVVAACSRLPPSWKMGDAAHGLAIKAGCGRDLFVGNSLISMYSVCSRMDSARKVFEGMSERDVVTSTCLVDGFLKTGELGIASELFRNMPEKNDISWVVMISGLVGAGMHEEALQHFHHMMAHCSKVKPNEAILVCVLSACAHMGALDQGKWIHAYIDKSRFPQSSNISTALINMYSKCGKIDCASQVFNTSPKRDVWTWTSMISGLAMHGLGRDALKIFNQMVDGGTKPDSVTLLGVLHGCSHSGLLDEGISIFYDMNSLWGVAPEIEHYGCLIDLLGRSRQLEKAFETAMSMPLQPDIVIWRSLLSACRVHINVGLAERVMDIIKQIDPNSQGEGQVLLSNLYAATDRWEGVVSTRSSISKGTNQLSPGCSWIEDDGVVHKFLAAERMHPRIDEIHDKLNEVLERARLEGGYIAITKNVLFDLSEEEKEQAVSWHSEKLALAFGLISTEPGSSIRIMKNLRICEDCHSLMKSVSLVYCREIVVRDRSRFHTFLEEICAKLKLENP